MSGQTWSWIELIWTVANVVGVLGNARLARLARDKRSAVIERGAVVGGPRVIAGDRRIRNDLGRLLCHLIGAAIGVYALLVYDANRLLSALAGWALVAIMAVLAVLAIFDLLDEARLDRVLDREQEQGGGGGPRSVP
jgi:hypothetical protein